MRITFDHLFVFDLRCNKIIRLGFDSGPRIDNLASIGGVVRGGLVAESVEALSASL